MCTKEIAALMGVLALGLATCISLISVSGFMDWLEPRHVPAKSELTNWEWKSEFGPENITEDVMNSWEADGYQVFRQAVDPKAVGLLLEEAKRLCHYQFMISRICQIEEGRWQSDLIRDFIFYSGLGALAGKLIHDARNPPMRVYQDGILGMTKSWLPPLFYSFTKHIDHGGLPGVYHGLHSDTLGVSFWIPLVEIDPNVTGGGIELYSGFPLRGCQVIWGEESTIDGFKQTLNMTKINSLCQKYKADNITVKPVVKPGDVVAWWPQMLHKTQRITQKGFERYALYVRFVSNETMVCSQKDCGWKGRPCCAAKLPKSGTLIDTPCYPQVFPTTLDHEVRAHFSKRPQPLIDRRGFESKYTKDIWGAMHPVCRKHRQGGPKRFWAPLKNEQPLPELARPKTVNASKVFGCHVEGLEGDCWTLDKSQFDKSLVHSMLVNYTTVGVPMFFSKDLYDLEMMYRIPWGGSVRGVKDSDHWIKVGDYFALEDFYNGKMVPADAEAAEAEPPALKTEPTSTDAVTAADEASAAEEASRAEEQPSLSAQKRSEEL